MQLQTVFLTPLFNYAIKIISMSSSAIKVMKQILLLLCAVILLLDLADDGCLGKAAPLVLNSPGTFTFTSSPGNSAKVETQVWLPPTALLDISRRLPNRATLGKIDREVKIIPPYLFVSSGGIPL